MDESCNIGAPDFSPEGTICANEGEDDEAYCSYRIGTNTCAFCPEYAVECNSDIDCESSDQWCSEIDSSKFCKNYVGEGESCEAFGLMEDYEMCNPDTHHCYRPEACFYSDIPGTCVPKLFTLREGDCCRPNGVLSCPSNNCTTSIIDGEAYRLCGSGTYAPTPEPTTGSFFANDPYSGDDGNSESGCLLILTSLFSVEYMPAVRRIFGWGN